MSDTVKMKSGYPFAVGRIRAIEDTVFSREQYLRLLSEDRDAQLRLLVEFGYPSAEGGLEAMIDAQLAEVKALMDEIAPVTEITDLFFCEYDAHNLKALLKARLLRTDADDILLSCGVFDTEVLKVCVAADEYSMLGSDFEPLAALEGVTDPSEISRAVDNAVYSHIFKVLKKYRIPALTEYFRLKAGYTNKLTRIRAKKLGLSDEAVEALLIDGDFTEPETEAETAAEFERELVRKLNEYLRGARFDPFGPSALFSYINDKQNEARNIRIIFAGGGENDIDV